MVTTLADTIDRTPVTGRSLRLCQLDTTHLGHQWAHRVSRGRQGSGHYTNGLWLCATHHALSHAEQDLSRRCGWMVPTGLDPATVPALIDTQAGPGWWILTDPFRAAEPDELPDDAWSGTLAEAVAELHRRRS